METIERKRSAWHRGRGLAAWAVLCLPLFAAVANAQAPKVTGSLDTADQVRVLRLWGDTRERGFAHGYLLGPQIVSFLEDFLLDPRITPDVTTYDARLREKIVPRFQLADDRRVELEGMVAGIVASVGKERARLQRVGRELSVNDLIALNTLADYAGYLCSSFSVWGDATADGGMITARNLDYADLPGLREHPVVIVYQDAGPGRKRWVSLAWPGLIGAYSAMNEEGVTVSMHDSQGLTPKTDGPFVPRSFALREIMERAAAASAVEDARGVLQRSPAMRGNNIHVSSPYSGQPIPAAVFEYDGDLSLDGGVTLRTSADNSIGTPAQSVYCTNHYRKRREAVPCNRFAAIESGLGAAQERGKKLAADEARTVIQSAAVEKTLQTVVYLPNRREMLASFAAPGVNAAKREPVRLQMADLLKRP